MSQKNLMILTVGLVLVVVGGVVHYAALTSGWNRLAALDRERQALNALADDEPSLSDEVAELKRQVAAEAAALPEDAAIGRLLSAIGADLRELGVRERSLTMGTAATLGDLEQLPLNLSFRGSFESVYQMLDRLHGYDRVVRLERVAIAREPRASGDALSVTARLVTFARGDQEGRR